MPPGIRALGGFVDLHGEELVFEHGMNFFGFIFKGMREGNLNLPRAAGSNAVLIKVGVSRS